MQTGIRVSEGHIRTVSGAISTKVVAAGRGEAFGEREVYRLEETGEKAHTEETTLVDTEEGE